MTGQLLPSPGAIEGLAGDFPWYAETRPRAVVKPGSLPGAWAAGPTTEGRVRWCFDSEAGQRAFRALHGTKVILAGFLGPLTTESRIWE